MDLPEIRLDAERPADVHECKICAYRSNAPAASELGSVRGNTARFATTNFPLWQCPRCLSIHSLAPVDFADIYSDYPLARRKLDVFARGTLRNLLQRLRRVGMSKTSSILDFGSGNGLFVDFLKQEGYDRIVGFDPYVPAFSQPVSGPFDVVIANDVIEHVSDPYAMVRQCIALLKPGGVLYLGTADSEPVDMRDLDDQLMRLHQPFHRVIVTGQVLAKIGSDLGLTVLQSYRRSYMDTLRPFSNYRFLDEFNGALGHTMDRAFDPDAGKVLLRRPALWFWAFFGYFFPSAYEPAVVLRRPVEALEVPR